MREARVRFVVVTKRTLLIAVLLFFGLLALLLMLASRTVPITGDGLHLRSPDVVLDAGHGGIDSGAHDGHGVYEKDIVLDVVLRMRDYLEKRGLVVELTRETDQDVSGFAKYRKGRHRQDLINRVQIMNRGKVAVSIHVNALNDPSAHGAVVFYAKGSEKGKLLAQYILAELAKVQDLNHSFVVPRQNIYVLRNTAVPTVLVELGFISNPKDKERLTKESYRQTLAEAVSQGIIKYFTVDKQSTDPTDGHEKPKPQLSAKPHPDSCAAFGTSLCRQS